MPIKKGSKFYNPEDVDLKGLRELFGADERKRVQEVYEGFVGDTVANGTIRMYFSGHLRIPEDFIRACLQVAQERKSSLEDLNKQINDAHNEIVGPRTGKVRKPRKTDENKTIDSFNLLLNK